MKDYFNNPETNKLFHSWICNYPESFHPLDMNRFYDFILSLFSTNEELTESILTSAIQEEKEWIEESTNEFVETFIEKYWNLKRFWEYA